MEQLGEEPDPEKMPLSEADFPHEVQVAFFMYSLLSDRWDGSSGAYFGKDWAPIESFFRIFTIEDVPVILSFMKLIEHHSVEFINERTNAKRKSAEKAASGKQYAHNVRG